MTSSINQPWALSEKLVTRYGTTWAKTDIILFDVSESQFKTDPMNTLVGQLRIGDYRLKLKYKTLIAELSRFAGILENLKISKLSPGETLSVEFGTSTLNLKHYEISYVYETLKTAYDSIQKSYQIGLYL